MAVEAKRGCGYRRAGGLYLVSDGLSEPCDRLPIPVVPCPCCGERIKQVRGFQWVTRDYALKGAKPCTGEGVHSHRSCVVCTPDLMSQERYGLIWVGEAFYPTMDDWAKEAMKLGVSKRVNAIPKGVEIGVTWVLVAHPKGVMNPTSTGEDDEFAPAICSAFRVKRIELIVTPSMKKEKWVKDLVKKGVTLVEVPENDKDHAPKKSRKSARRRAMDKAAKRFEEDDLFEKDEA
jgi:hypothetical protein